MELTPRQTSVFNALKKFIDENDYPPSVRELGKLVNLRSPASVQRHLEELEENGYIFRADGKFRSIRILKSDSKSFDAPEPTLVPLVGSVAAGVGVLADEQIEDIFPLPPELTSKGKLFALRVRGDSMRDAAILDQDWVIVRSQNTAENGDLVVAGIGDEEATVKQFFKRGKEVVLEPANPDFEPICLNANEAVIYGKVISVLRRL